jgi:hypothetical protein
MIAPYRQSADRPPEPPALALPDIEPDADDDMADAWVSKAAPEDEPLRAEARRILLALAIVGMAAGLCWQHI